MTSLLPERQDIADRLLAWAHDHLRDLPWRRARSSYQVWVSEVMLQQTRVTTVVPYFDRWMRRFPTIHALAAASLDDVLKAWEGLGYYARARNLHKAARQIVREHGGHLPADRDELLKLPGIGPYTAGAILSIAFGRDEPVLDGNVRRVLCRVFNIREDPHRSAVQRHLWSLARALLPPGRAGEFNQAMMDLGATVCTVRGPDCAHCPLADVCEAAHLGIQSQRPVSSRRPRIPHYEVTAAVIWRDGQVLITRRPYDRMLGGLWEFPGGKREPGESLVACLEREIREELGIEIIVDGPLPPVKHTYSHFRITLYPFHCRIRSGSPQSLECADWRWVTLDQFSHFAFSAADLRIIANLCASQEESHA
ncbi:MAG: A/G-specific adenine glycosylase [Anaerolineae bacterium]|nr:A/G-specific adenine glycosylase [Anaerolineae bacterium]